MPDVDGALAELAYALDDLRLDGVVLFSNARGAYLGDPRFTPLFDELLRPEGNGAAGGSTGQAQPAGASSGQRVTAGSEPQDPGTSATGQTDWSAAMGSEDAGLADPTRITTISE